MSKLPLEEGEKVYDKDSVIDTIEYVYYAVFEGDYNKFLEIETPKYDVFVKLPQPFIPGDNQDCYISDVLDTYGRAFKENTTRFSDTTISFCAFLDNYYPLTEPNKELKDKFTKTIELYVDSISSKALAISTIAESVCRAFDESLSKRTTSKLIPMLKERTITMISQRISCLKYDNSENISKSLSVINSFYILRRRLNLNFFSEITECNENIDAGVNYIFERCRGPVEDEEWRSFKEFFGFLPVMSPKYNLNGKKIQAAFGKDKENNDKIYELFEIYHQNEGAY